MKADETVGQLVRQAREARGLTLEDLAEELKLPLWQLQAMEADDWVALPPGRQRPLARQLAERLGVDLEFHTGAFQIVPGVQELEPPDPRQERLERVVMGLLTVASSWWSSGWWCLGRAWAASQPRPTLRSRCGHLRL